MIKFNKKNKSQNQRILADMLEPLAVKIVEKKYHDFFAYRCSDYQDLFHLARCHSFDINKIDALLLNKYWSAIDIIHLKVKDLPSFSITKEYFQEIRKIELTDKKVIDYEIFEVKAASENKKFILSTRAYALMKELEKIKKTMKLIKINLKGFLNINYEEKNLKNSDFRVITHYGRKDFYLDFGLFSAGN